MMNKKRTIATLASMIIGINTIPITMVNAKVIEPEIVKTETWTTSYYIDDDIETLYPYIDCQADIYNDGTVKVSFWNTHEWDGFATVKHDVNILGAGFNQLWFYKFDVNTCNKQYLTYTPSPQHLNMEDTFQPYPYYISYYSNDYVMQPSNMYSFKFYYGEILRYGDSVDTATAYGISVMRYYGSLSELPVNRIETLIFTPNVDPTDTYKFRIFEHDITITPEILSENIIAEPILTDTEKRIQELEKENAELKAQNENLLNIINSQGNRAYGDMNNDGFVDGKDATLLLTYYAKTSVGYIGSLNDFIKEQNGE